MPSERVQRRIDRLLDQAEEAADARDWSVVLECSEGVLALDSDNQDASAFIEMANRAVSVSQRSEAAEATAAPLKPAEFDGSAASSGPAAATDGAASGQPGQSSAAASGQATGSPTPTSFGNGRYVVKRFLGEGGKKQVYLATDTTLDRDVAFALIKTDGLDDIGRERVRREAQAMGRMGTHPCIMPIYDLGEEPDANGVAQPFMVQPLMGGGDVEGLVEDAGGPLPLDDAIRIATQTAQGLVFAHSKGIVHRDLKPGNVWLDDDGAAKIGDFGLAVATDRSRLTVEKVMVGTVNYMPPEQATGGEVTPRADLYSLGAMLYEMCTGRVPFMGDDDIAVISQHINTPPVAPSWHNAQVPKALDALILRLMSKDPSERPASADEVLTALGSIDLSAVEESGEERTTGSLESMAGGVFVGRQREMDQLKAIFEEVLSGRTRVVALVGEPGVGKTRTAEELATYATTRGAQALWGRCYEERGAPPFCPWLQSIWACAQPLEPGELRSKLGPGAPEIADAVPYIRDRLPDLPAAPELEPDRAQFRFFESTARFFRAMASDQPRLIILDDVHWADDSSLKLLGRLLHLIPESRLMVVITYRDSELSLRHPLSNVLADLQKEGGFQRVRFGGLNMAEIGRLIDMSAGITAPDDLSQSILSQTEGNPLFVTEIVRMLVQEEDLAPGVIHDGSYWTNRIPEGIKAVVGTRLARMSDLDYTVLSAASVIGREFQSQVLAGVIEGLGVVPDDKELEQVMDGAVENGIRYRVVEEIPGSPFRYRFTHSVIQQTLLEDLTSVRRTRIHSLTADALEQIDPNDVMEIVSHLLAAGSSPDRRRLATHALAAGELALGRYAYEKAEEVFDAALSLAGDEPRADLALLRRGLAIAQAALLRRQEAAANLEKAYDYFQQEGLESEAIRVALTPVFAGETGVPTLLEKAARIVEPNSHDYGRIASQLGLVIGNRGDYAGSVEAYASALEIALREEDPELEMWTLARYGHTEFFYNNMEGCVERDGRAIELNQMIGDPRVSAYAGYCLIFAHQALADHKEALAQSDLMLSSAEQARNRSSLISSLGTSVMLRILSGDWDGARGHIARGLSIHGDSATFHAYTLYLALLGGDTVAAQDAWERLRNMIADGAPAGLDTQMTLMAAALLSGDSRYCDSPTEFARKLHNSPNPLPLMTLESAFLLTGLAVVNRDPELARVHFKDLEREAQTLGISYVLFGKRLLANSARLLGEIQNSERHFAAAIQYCRDTGYEPELALSYSDYSELLLDRDAPGDRDKAIELQDEAISIARELGMKPLLERVLAKREILKA